ncbi:MAG: hypothetical protein ACOC5K_03330 [Chloroflexota bacterium]
MSLRSRRVLLRVAAHGGATAALLLGIVIAAVADSPGTAFFFGLLLLAYLATMRVNPLPRMLERRQLQELECAACGQIFELTSTWDCGCGFLAWAPRHALSPCPNCGKTFSWLQCPRCENGIPT